MSDIENVNLDDDNRQLSMPGVRLPLVQASNAQAAEQGVETLTELAEQA